jgi:hypothetical protein
VIPGLAGLSWWLAWHTIGRRGLRT